jgi:hypothetical protein
MQKLLLEHSTMHSRRERNPEMGAERVRQVNLDRQKVWDCAGHSSHVKNFGEQGGSEGFYTGMTTKMCWKSPLWLQLVKSA